MLADGGRGGRRDLETIIRSRDENVVFSPRVVSPILTKSTPFQPKTDNTEIPMIERKGKTTDVVEEEVPTNTEDFIEMDAIPITRVHKGHPIQNILGDLNLRVRTRSWI
ncbi:hypothetical protein QVD17_09037 [Tagetes erecta]|uniref:Uncharacterized protein n=1 Tax=Tagetes erecta TaxID=13708 RepID=A0AAD8L6J0_TARER|nr:hypothetical protein QVD17_09037 [Tagetes erecta]